MRRVLPRLAVLLSLRRVLPRLAVSFQPPERRSSGQPWVATGTTDVQAPFEAQGRGFVHGHGKVLLSLLVPVHPPEA